MNETIDATVQKKQWWGMRRGLYRFLQGLSLGMLVSGISVYVPYKIRAHAAEQSAAINAKPLDGAVAHEETYDGIALCIIRTADGRKGIELYGDRSGLQREYFDRTPEGERKFSEAWNNYQKQVVDWAILQEMDADGDRVVTQQEFAAYVRKREKKQ